MPPRSSKYTHLQSPPLTFFSSWICMLLYTWLSMLKYTFRGKAMTLCQMIISFHKELMTQLLIKKTSSYMINEIKTISTIPWICLPRNDLFVWKQGPCLYTSWGSNISHPHPWKLERTLVCALIWLWQCHWSPPPQFRHYQHLQNENPLSS